MPITRRSPLDLLSDFNRRMEKIMGDEGQGEDPPSTFGRWRPPTDVYRESDHLVFEVETPGLDRSDLDVSYENGRLTVSGERRPRKGVDAEGRKYYRSERLYGTFRRSFVLSDDVDPGEIHAAYDEGILTVRVPRSARSGRHRIDVT